MKPNDKELTPDRAVTENDRSYRSQFSRDPVRERLRKRQVAEMDLSQRVFSLKLTQFVWLVFGVIEGLIGLRVLLKLMAANPENPFARLVYGTTDVFLWPFRGLTVEPSAGGIVLELSSIIALVVYALLAWVIARALWILLYQPR